jgi:hypothetical protein
MASGWRVVLEQELPANAAPADTGKALLYFQRQIDELAERLQVPSLSGFFSRSPYDIAEYLRGQGVEPNFDHLPDEEWFDAAEGLRTVRAIIEELRTFPAAVPAPEKVVADLEDVERALILAESKGLRFHLGRTLDKRE